MGFWVIVLITIDDGSSTRTENVKPGPATARFVSGALPVTITAVESQSGTATTTFGDLRYASRASPNLISLKNGWPVATGESPSANAARCLLTLQRSRLASCSVI